MTEFLGSLVTPKATSAPTSPVTGQLWYDTAADALKWWNGTEWVTASGRAYAAESARKAATGNLTLTSAEQDIAGCTYTTINSGKFLVTAFFDAQVEEWASMGAVQGSCSVNGVIQAGVAILVGPTAGDRVTAGQQWLVEASAGQVIKLRGFKQFNLGKAVMNSVHTTISVVQVSGAGATNFGLVSTLPASPTKGDICSFWADKTNGVVWQFVYDGEGTYPWKFVGGTPLAAEVETEQTTTSTTLTNLTTEGPFVTVPLAGDWDVSLKAMMTNTVANSHSRMSYSIAATAANIVDGMDTLDAGNGFTVANNMRTKRKTFATASQKLVAKYAVAGVAGEGKFANRRIEIIPVRVK